MVNRPWKPVPVISLRWALVVPLVLQIVGIVALVGYLSYRSGEQATENLATQLLQQTSARVQDRLNNYLHTPPQIVASNRLEVAAGTLHLNDRDQLRRRLWQQMILNPAIPFNAFWSTTGRSVSYIRLNSEAVRQLAAAVSGQPLPLGAILFSEITPNQRQFFWTDAQGQPTKLLYQYKDDFRTAPWYSSAQSSGKQHWTPIVLARVIPVLQTMAVAPVTDGTGNVQGFFTASYFLPEISLFLNQLQFSPHGMVLIVERSGDLVATSIPAEGRGMTYRQGKPVRLSILNSEDARTRAVGQQLFAQFGNFDGLTAPHQLQLTVLGQRHFGQITPYHDQAGLDWHIVTVIPESDFMAAIQQNSRTTVGLCLLALGGAIAIGFTLANRFSAQMTRLYQASQALAGGDLDQQLPNDSAITEVQGLVQSFNQMAAQLRQLFQQQADRNQQLANMNQELAQATRLKDEFLATMSHELRTPLNAILGMTEGLQDEILGSVTEPQRLALTTIERSGHHLLALINDILDLSTIESGQIQLHCAPTDLVALCQTSLNLIEPQAHKKQIQCELKYPADVPLALIDERRICQVLVNLLENAVKFTGPQGHITVEIRVLDLPPERAKTQSRLQVAVKDTGIGIAAANVQSLFQPFVQIDSALNRHYEGTGLGLALVKRIVVLHGGQIRVTSELGVGSCFIIDLPWTTLSSPTPPQPMQTAAPNKRDLPNQGAVPVILLVEDNVANSATISHYLQAKGTRVLVAKTGQEALSLVQAEPPDLILMDIQLPEMDGLEAIRQIRRLPHGVDMPIIALTALAMATDRERCLAAGANDYLSKPVKLKQLLAIIQQLLKLN